MPHILKFVPRSRARNNMAVRILPGGGVEFDTPEEMIAYQRALGKVGVAPVTPVPTRRAAPVQDVSPETRRDMDTLLGGSGGYQAGVRSRTGRAPRLLSSAESLSVPTLAKVIGEALGGMDSYCPGRRVVFSPQQQLRLAEYKKLSTTDLQKMAGAGDALAAETLRSRVPHEVVLKEMGLTDDSIRALATALRGQGLLEVVTYETRDGKFGETLRAVGIKFGPQKDLNLVAKAKAIAEGFGLSCRTRSNPYRGR